MKKPAPQTTHANRQIVGFSLPRDMARAVKTEAARRGISLKKLFEELWSTYDPKKHPPEKS